MWDTSLGMDHFLARDYLPQTGRFNGSDPVMEYSNPYSYVANRPMYFVERENKRFALLPVGKTV